MSVGLHHIVDADFRCNESLKSRMHGRWWSESRNEVINSGRVYVQEVAMGLTREQVEGTQDQVSGCQPPVL